MRILTSDGFTYYGNRVWFFDWFAHIWGTPGVDFFVVDN